MRPRSSIAAAVGVASLACILWLGCGVKSPPIPPQQAMPEKIVDLSAVSQKGGILLSWGRPERYAGGKDMKDLGRFEIDRAQGIDKYQPVAEIPVTDRDRFQKQRRFTWLDGTAELGQTYSYRLISVTEDGYRSDPSNSSEVTRTVPEPAPNPENFVLPRPTPLP